MNSYGNKWLVFQVPCVRKVLLSFPSSTLNQQSCSPYDVIMRPNPPLVAAEEINGEYVFPNVCTEVLTKLFTRLKLCFGA